MVVAEGGDREILIAVAVEIATAHIGDARKPLGRDMGHETAAAGVFQDDDRSDPLVAGKQLAEVGDEQIEVAVAVMVDRLDMTGSCELRRSTARCTRLSELAGSRRASGVPRRTRGRPSGRPHRDRPPRRSLSAAARGRPVARRSARVSRSLMEHPQAGWRSIQYGARATVHTEKGRSRIKGGHRRAKTEKNQMKLFFGLSAPSAFVLRRATESERGNRVERRAGRRLAPAGAPR